jgi:hypothetical protein
MENKINLNSNGTHSSYNWTSPKFIEAIDTGNSIEFIYKQYRIITNLGILSNQNQERVFKIVYSCIEGKWNRSERIYGTIIPASEEDYEFED